MLAIDKETMLIELTRGDSAVITFDAMYEDGSYYFPVAGDVLSFAVAKRRNKDPIFQIENTFGDFSSVSPTEEEFNANKEIYFTVISGEFVRCSSSSVYSSSTQYYVSKFWDIAIVPEHTAEMKSGDYVWDVQIENADGTITTIIGETDTLNPLFHVWGEVTQ